MFFCVNCGNNIKSSNKQFNTSARTYKMTGCPRWRYHVKCDYCNKINDYKNVIKHKLLFTPILNLREDGKCKKFGEVNMITGAIDYDLATQCRLNSSHCGILGSEYTKKGGAPPT
jgi:hypothetical protein